MKKIIISEKAEKILFEYLLNENYDISDKVSLVKKYLDSKYIKADKDVYDKNNDSISQMLVIMKDTKGMPSKQIMTLEQLYEKLKFKYQNILTDKIERNKFLWQIVNDWFYNRISKSFVLSNTNYGNVPN